MRLSIHLFTTPVLPEFEEEHGAELLLVEDEGAELEAGAEIPSEEFEYATTLVTNYEDLDLMRSAVDQWWLDWAGVSPRLDLIGEDSSRFTADQLQRAQQLTTPNSWSINTAFVAFRPDSREARAEAIRFLTDSAILSH